MTAGARGVIRNVGTGADASGRSRSRSRVVSHNRSTAAITSIRIQYTIVDHNMHQRQLMLYVVHSLIV